MAKIVFNPMIDEIHGGVNNLVVRQYKGQYVLGKRARSGQEPTAAQTAHKARFLKAVGFGKSVMADATVRPLYQQAADQRELPVFAVCIADWFNAPTIESISALDYNGNAGDPIQIIASDDFGVVRVDVKLSDHDQGTLIESGQAVETPAGSGHWTYTSTQLATPGSTVQFQVTVSDRPGGMTVQRGTKRI